MHGELSEAWHQLSIIAHESVKAYKNSNECANTKRDFATTSYIYGWVEVQAIVLIKFLTLRLDFLNERFDDEDNAEGTKALTNSPNEFSLIV